MNRPFRLFVHQDAIADLIQLKKDSPPVAARIKAFLEELDGNQDLLDRLTQQGFANVRFDVKKFEVLWHKGHDIWRLRLWAVQAHRIIYAYMPKSNHYLVLAIAPRDFNYDPAHEITKRLLDVYRQLK